MEKKLPIALLATAIFSASFAQPESPSKARPCNAFIFVRALKQPDAMSSWATAFTILYSRKYGDPRITIENALKKYGDQYVDIFKQGKGISAKDEAALYASAKMEVLQFKGTTVDSWCSLLMDQPFVGVAVETKPPLGTTHAFVVHGLKGDGTPAGTFFNLVDTADGRSRTMPFNEFTALFHGPVQVFYWRR
ncbi:MAG TPA: papain-like cysteine protease family protein [Chryseosolibacter sp.]